MTSNLASILGNLKVENSQNKCSVCKAVTQMDKETKAAFIDVMHSTVTIKAIVEALSSEGVQLTRFQLGETRRECINGTKPCVTFKGESK